jgi:hypothetical protein
LVNCENWGKKLKTEIRYNIDNVWREEQYVFFFVIARIGLCTVFFLLAQKRGLGGEEKKSKWDFNWEERGLAPQHRS